MMVRNAESNCVCQRLIETSGTSLELAHDLSQLGPIQLPLKFLSDLLVVG